TVVPVPRIARVSRAAGARGLGTPASIWNFRTKLLGEDGETVGHRVDDLRALGVVDDPDRSHHVRCAGKVAGNLQQSLAVSHRRNREGRQSVRQTLLSSNIFRDDVPA